MDKFVHPLDRAEKAIQQARKLTKKTYGIETLQALAEHNMDGLVPALKALLAWAKDIEKSTKQLEAKKRSAEQKRRRDGKQ
jgi:hypothetical protein